jgi:hypothetical protein
MANVMPVVWMVGIAAVLWLAITAASRGTIVAEATAGGLVPLVGAVGSWLLTARAHAIDPARVTGVLVVSFGVKAVLFGACVVGGVRGLGLRPVPFVASFAVFFVALYAMEAFFLRRLFAGRSQVLVSK